MDDAKATKHVKTKSAKTRSWPFTQDWKDTYPAIKLPPKEDDLVVASVKFIRDKNMREKTARFLRGGDKSTGIINFNTERSPLAQVEDLIASWYICSCVFAVQGVLYVYFIECALFYEITVDVGRSRNSGFAISAVECIVDEDELRGKVVLLTSRVRLPQLTGIWTRFASLADLPPVRVDTKRARDMAVHFRITVRSLIIPTLIEDRAPTAFHYWLRWYRAEFEITRTMIKMAPPE